MTKQISNSTETTETLHIEEAVLVESGASTRAKIFANAGKIKKVPYSFNGVDLVFVQPHIGKMYGSERAQAEGKSFIVTAMIENTVVPGTSEKVFTFEDYDSIMEMPLGPDMQKITKIITEMYGMNVEEEAKN